MEERISPLRRDLDFIPVEHQGKRMLLVRDPLGLVAEGRAFEADFAPLLAVFSREMSISELQAVLTELQGGEPVSLGDIDHVVGELDGGYLLDSPRFHAARDEIVQAFASLPLRAPILAGTGYPDDPEELGTLLETMLMEGREPDIDGDVKAIVAPHIDLGVGRRVYASAYRALADARPERIIILGVGHQLMDGLFSLTPKDFATPFGTLRADTEAVNRLRSVGGEIVAPSDFEHKSEHSIEFQSLFVANLLGAQESGPRIVPILCASPGLLESYERASFRRQAGPFLDALAELAADPGTVVLAGVDLSHIGPKFGDEQEAAAIETDAVAHDTALMERLAARDADGFWAESIRVRDRFHVCGFGALATLLEILPPGTGSSIDYEMWHEAPTRSAVSFAAAVFTS
jgi:hypothetical protein